MATPEVIAEQQALVGINADYKEKYGFFDPENAYAYKAPKGLTRELVEQISEFKNEPQWMREFRLKALGHFLSPPGARRCWPRSTTTTSTTSYAPPRSRRRRGTTSPRTSSARSTGSASP